MPLFSFVPNLCPKPVESCLAAIPHRLVHSFPLIPGRFGYSHPVCCRLEWKTDSTGVLEFLFITYPRHRITTNW
jgi:hypothetical protein